MTTQSPRTERLDDDPYDQERDHPKQLAAPHHGAKIEDGLPLDLPVPYHVCAHRLGVHPEAPPECSPPRAAPEPPRALTLAAGITLTPPFS